MRGLDDLAKMILDKLDIKYVSTCAQDSILAVDSHETATYDVNLLRDILSEDELKALYKNITLCWIFNTDALTNHDWGKQADGTPTEFVLKNAFNTTPHVCLYRCRGMSATPINMIAVAEDKTYFKVCVELFKTMSETYDEILSMAVSLPVSELGANAVAIDTYVTSFTQLQTLLLSVVPNITSYEIPENVQDIKNYLFTNVISNSN